MEYDREFQVYTDNHQCEAFDGVSESTIKKGSWLMNKLTTSTTIKDKI